MTDSFTDVFAPEREALAALAQTARDQLAALRAGSSEQFEEAAGRTLDVVADLDHRRRARERRTAAPDAPPLGPDARAALQASALEARQACDSLEIALTHAVALGRDLIGAWYNVASPPTANVYTAQGAVVHLQTRMSLNSIYSTARRALLSSQAGINATGNNIANAETPGYTRRSASTRLSAPVRGGVLIPSEHASVGSGAGPTEFNRVRSGILDHAVRFGQASSGGAGESAGLARRRRVAARARWR